MQRLAGTRVLAIDDNTSTREMLKENTVVPYGMGRPTGNSGRESHPASETSNSRRQTTFQLLMSSTGVGYRMDGLETRSSDPTQEKAGRQRQHTEAHFSKWI